MLFGHGGSVRGKKKSLFWLSSGIPAPPSPLLLFLFAHFLGDVSTSFTTCVILVLKEDQEIFSDLCLERWHLD